LLHTSHELQFLDGNSCLAAQKYTLSQIVLFQTSRTNQHFRYCTSPYLFTLLHFPAVSFHTRHCIII